MKTLKIFKAFTVGILLTLASWTTMGESNWMTDFDAALKKADKENKIILVDFTGSDWCGWCMKLDKEVFSQKAFKEYAAKNLVLVKCDFPNMGQIPQKTKIQNERLARKYGVEGFPTIVLLNSKGKRIATTGYAEGGAKNYIKHLEKLIGKK